MNAKQPEGIWVFAEQRGGELHEVSLELLAKALDLAEQVNTPVTAVLLGQGITRLAPRLIHHGADVVLVVDQEELGPYRLLAYAHVLTQLIRERGPEIVLMGATSMGMELAPRVAARLRTGLSAHCIDLRLDGERNLLQVVPGWGGGVIATILCPETRPQMATVMPGAMKARPPSKREGVISPVSVDLPDEDLGPEVLELTRERPEAALLEKAEVVVAGGWGIGGKGQWKMVEDLAQVLGGAVGATRPPVDEGWVPEGRMIGQSGKTVRPSLYIGIAISGVMHHVVGMDQSLHVISINSNPKAEIFEVSDVIVVEDFRKIVPKLIEAVRSKKGDSP